MFIFYAFFLAPLAYALHPNTPTPIFSSKTNIDPKKSKKILKIPNFPQNPIFQIFIAVNLRNLQNRYFIR